MKYRVLIGTIVTLIVFILALIAFLGLSMDNLHGTSWKLEKWSNSSSLSSSIDITLKFNKNGTASGNGGVNSYSMFYNISIDNIMRFNEITSTDMASTDNAKNKAESIYFSLLSKVKYYKFSGKKLLLLDNEKKVILTFKENS